MAQKAARSKAKQAETPQFKSAFSSFSVDDIPQAKSFYGETLGLDVQETNEGLRIDFDDGHRVFIYPKDDHEAATFTVLNLVVDDISSAVEALGSNGITFEQYGGDLKTDKEGIFWGGEEGDGPNIAWFRDPAGNFVSVIEE